MNILRQIILILIFCNFPGFALVNINETAGTIFSYATFFLIIIYYFLGKKDKIPIPFLLLGLSYFWISLLVDNQNADFFFINFFKYFIFTLLGITIVNDTKIIEIYFVLILGALSILFESIFIFDIGGRYSGFYLNPNSAGFVCILGYCYSYLLKDKKIVIIGQLLFTIAGIVTFSRTFLLVWIIVSLLSIGVTYKNAYKVIMGVVIVSLFLSYADRFDFNTKRLDTIMTLFDGKISDNIDEGSRTETWSLYYDKIIEKPFFGNGYLAFSGQNYSNFGDVDSVQGVHNTFLMIIGEAGIISFIIIIYIYLNFFLYGFQIFRYNSVFCLLSLILIIYMLTSHNYFNNYLLLFISLWLFIKKDSWDYLNYKRKNHENTYFIKRTIC